MKKPDNQSSLFQQRHPYASEAKKIIADRMVEKFDEWNERLGKLKAECFTRLWIVDRKQGGLYEVSRDYKIAPKTELDAMIEASLEQIYKPVFKEVDGKLTSRVILSKIEGPTGHGLKGAGGKLCCFSGACVGCPQNRA